MKQFQGNGCAGGYARSNVLKKEMIVEAFDGFADNAEDELDLLESGMKKLERRLECLYNKTLEESGEEAAELIETYQVILYDKQFFDKIRDRIRREKVSCCTAIQEECALCRKTFSEMEDSYMRERIEDIQAVCNELTSIICDVPDMLAGVKLTKPVMIVADNLTPVDTVKMDKKYLCGFVTEAGGETSHAVILARTLGIPAVTGVAGIMDAVRNDMEILVDGKSGKVVLEPDGAAQIEFDHMVRKAEEESLRFSKESPGEIYTKDGQRIRLCINASDSAKMPEPGLCDGIGLFRTEFLYMQQDGYPSEEILFRQYRKAVEEMDGREVVFRTLDIGGDKALEYMEIPKEENPFLGYRAVRICLDRPELFRVQLRAILRASSFGNVRIMFPMISNIEEVLQCRAALKGCMEELRIEGAPYDEDIPVGIMVETPSAVLILDQLALYADFFSVGTNDLTQYFMAADRGNPSVQGLYDSFYPSVLRALYHIGQTAQKYGVQLSVCGEAAADMSMIPFLIGCGVEKLSVAESSLSKERYFLRRIHKKECGVLAEKIIRMESIQEIKKELQEYAENILKAEK